MDQPADAVVRAHIDIEAAFLVPEKVPEQQVFAVLRRHHQRQPRLVTDRRKRRFLTRCDDLVAHRRELAAQAEDLAPGPAMLLPDHEKCDGEQAKNEDVDHAPISGSCSAPRSRSSMKLRV